MEVEMLTEEQSKKLSYTNLGLSIAGFIIFPIIFCVVSIIGSVYGLHFMDRKNDESYWYLNFVAIAISYAVFYIF